MFLSSISKTCQELGLAEAGAEFSLALDSVLAAASHTNIMMWIGRMVNCPIDLPSQGQLIKHGNVCAVDSVLQFGHRYCDKYKINIFQVLKCQ